jgi:hypothetical protein
LTSGGKVGGGEIEKRERKSEVWTNTTTTTQQQQLMTHKN